ncbi:MAG TPA: hypothetical protein VN281_21800 [Verrucomicrobiae bacterium]|nr:hypothetical protein [Verrucomicrobiae bacterium]
MNDQRFFDLAMKMVTRTCTDAERTELDSLMAAHPELKAELEKLQTDTRLAREALPLLAAMEATSPELPAYAREPLRTKVRQTLGRPAPSQAKPFWNWRWILGLAAGGTAVVVLLLVLMRQPEPVIQVAMLDTVGGSRGPAANDIDVLQQEWSAGPVASFDKATEMENWKTNWPTAREVVAKVSYDRASAEVRVLLRRDGKTQEKTFVVDHDLASTLKEADGFIRDQTRR